MSLRWLHQKATSQQHHGEVQARGCWIPWEHTAVPGDPGLPRRPAELLPLELTRVSKSLCVGHCRLTSSRLFRVEGGCVSGTADTRLAESGLGSGRQGGCKKKNQEKGEEGRVPLICWCYTHGPWIKNGKFEFHLPKTY